jgi:hypothetical protein
MARAQAADQQGHGEPMSEHRRVVAPGRVFAGSLRNRAAISWGADAQLIPAMSARANSQMP